MGMVTHKSCGNSNAICASSTISTCAEVPIHRYCIVHTKSLSHRSNHVVVKAKIGLSPARTEQWIRGGQARDGPGLEKSAACFVGRREAQREERRKRWSEKGKEGRGSVDPNQPEWFCLWRRRRRPPSPPS